MRRARGHVSVTCNGRPVSADARQKMPRRLRERVHGTDRPTRWSNPPPAVSNRAIVGGEHPVTLGRHAGSYCERPAPLLGSRTVSPCGVTSEPLDGAAAAGSMSGTSRTQSVDNSVDQPAYLVVMRKVLRGDRFRTAAGRRRPRRDNWSEPAVDESAELVTVWNRVGPVFRRSVHPSAAEGPGSASPARWDSSSDTALLAAPNDFAKDYLENRLRPLIAIGAQRGTRSRHPRRRHRAGPGGATGRPGRLRPRR